MSNLKLVILLGFVFMFIAGLAVGRAPRPEPAKDQNRSWLGNALHLTPDQQKQMKVIWSNPAVTRPDIPKLCREADRQRDEAVRNLLTPEEKQKFEQIQKDHDAKVAAFFGERNQAMRDAEDKTRQMLSDEQRKKYEEILKAHGHLFGPQRDRDRATHHRTRPSSETKPSAAAA